MSSRCRTCGLSTNSLCAKNIFEEGPDDILFQIEMITGILIAQDVENRLPNAICSCCLLDLKNAIAFRERCVNTQIELHKEIEFKYSIEQEEPQPPEAKHNGQPQPPTDYLDLTEGSPQPIKAESPLCVGEAIMHAKEASPTIDANQDEKASTASELSPASSEYIPKNETKKRNRKEHGIPPTCDQCGEHFNNKSALKKHMISHNEIKQCSICDARYFTTYQLNQHIRKAHNVKQFDEYFNTNALQTDRKKRRGDYACEICGMAFAFKSTLNHHWARHSGESKHRCDICNIIVSNKYILKAHFSSQKHLEKAKKASKLKKSLECKVCGKEFKHKNALKKHITTHFDS